MNEAKVYPVKHERYAYMVKFSRKGFKPYRRYFKDKKLADADAAEFNKKLFREGSEGIHSVCRCIGNEDSGACRARL